MSTQILALSLDWMNYPGLEVWKFINLALFLGVAIFILRKPLKNALHARGEQIKLELIKAREERDEARARLEETESLLAQVGTEVQRLHEQARTEADLERERLAQATQRDIEKLHQQAERELDMARRVARKALREYLAQRSVELAGESVRRQIRPEDDARLINANIGQLRRSRG